MDKSKENSAELVLHEEENSAIVNAGETRLPFAVAGSNGSGLNQAQLEKIFMAQSLDFDMKGEYWSPEKPGERKRVVFQYMVKGELVPNKYQKVFEDQIPNLIPLDVAYFVELFQEDGVFKQRMLRSCSTVVVSFIERNRVPKHAILDIEFKGKKKGEKFMYDDFAFIPVPVTFND